MISYIDNNIDAKSDAYSQLLRQTQEEFSESYGVNVLGAGIEEVMLDPSLFDSYKEKLLNGVGASESETLQTLMDGARQSTFASENTASITPFSALQLPLLRKFWPQVGAVHAIPTTAVKKPIFDLRFQRAYVLDAERNKIYLPEGLRSNGGNAMSAAERPKLSSDPISIPCMNQDLLAAVGATKVAGDEIDIDFYVVSATITVTNSAGDSPEDVEVTIQAKMDELNNMFQANVSAAHTDETITTDIIQGSVNRYEGTATISSVLGHVKSVVVKGFLNTNTAKDVAEVGFEINSKRVSIPTSGRIGAPISTEYMQDLNAMYSIDGFLKLQETISSFLAQKLDISTDNFFAQILSENEIDPSRVQYSRSFNVVPGGSFSGSPKEWREELKTVIDHMSITMRNDSSFQGGKFTILCNPLDSQLISNDDWIVSSGSEHAGVDVEYSVGTYQAANRYSVVASPNIAQSKMKVLFIPSSPEQKTVDLYAYSYNVETASSGYRMSGPATENLPSMQVNRRDKFDVITPLLGEITIQNNTGQLPA